MPLTRIDPSTPHGALTRALHAFGRSPAGRWYGIAVASRVDPWLLRVTDGRLCSVGPMPTALLGHTGARSGQPRSNPLLYFHDGDDVVLVASSFGRDRHPAWYHNLRAHPECTLNGDPYLAREVEAEAERRRLYGLAVRLYPGYADYEARTTRRIPVLRLTPR